MFLCQAPAYVLHIWYICRTIWSLRNSSRDFFSYFGMDPNCLLSDDVKQYISSLGFNAKVLCLTFKLCGFFIIVLRQFTVDNRPVYSWQIIQFHVLGNCSGAEIQEVYARVVFLAVCLDIHATIYSIFYNPCEFWLLTWFLLADLWRRVEIFRGYLPYSTTVRRIAAIEVN